jgi:hypothetical protein
MTLTAVGRNCQLQKGDHEDYPVYTLTKILNGTAVALNALGYLVELTDSAAVIFVGIAMTDVDNSTGLSGAVTAPVRRKGVHAMVTAGLAITDSGCDLYWSDNQTVTKSATNQYAGKLVRYTSATEALLDIEGAVRDNPDVATYNALVAALTSATLPVYANKVITAGDLIATTSDGYVLRANDALACKFVGVAQAAADNTGGASGAITVVVLQLGKVTLAGTTAAFTQADVERPVFVSSATLVTLTPTDKSLFVGRIARFISTTSVAVDLTPGVIGMGMDVMSYPVGASKNINVLGAMIAIDPSTGGAELANGAAACDFVGIGLMTVDNSSGSLGDKIVWVARTGVFQLTGSGLAATDVGKEVWVGADSVTVTTTPGDKLVGHLEKYQTGATVALVRIRPLPARGSRTDRRFMIPFQRTAKCGVTAGAKVFEDREFGRKWLPLAAFVDCETAPSGSYYTTYTLSDGTTATFAFTITGAATHGEQKTAGTVPQLANTDTDLTGVDDNASTATANIHGWIEAEWC